jgi:hypothetical protein
MNELEQRALDSVQHAARAAHGWVRGHPAASLAAAGFAAGWLTVISGGRVGTVRTVIPLTSWLGMLPRTTGPHGDWAPAVIMLAGIATLVVLWLAAIRRHHSGTISEPGVWGICAAWSTPFVIGPPLLSNDVFTYAAQGLLLRDGFDPYKVGPAALGNVHAVAAVDPSWRSVPSPYGPLATTLQHLAIAISGGSPLGAVLVFRAIGVLCLVAIGVLAADLAGPRRVQALTLTVLNPLVLLQVVSAAHLDGVMCVLVLAAVAAANQRRWLTALMLAAAAGSVKAPAYLAVVAIIVVHHGVHRPMRWRILIRDVAVGVGAVGVFALAVPDGWGWINGLNAPALGHTSLAPATLLADVMKPIVRGASYDDLSAGGRITALVAAGCIGLYLLITADRRAVERTVGYGLLAVGLLSPVVYPWYLLAGVACLLPAARGARRDWLVLLSAVGCLLSPAGFSSGVSTGLSVGALGVALAVIAPRVWARRIAAATPAPVIVAG